MRPRLVALVALLALAGGATAQPGTLDPSFGTDGVVVYRGLGDARFQDVLVRPDGSVVAVGSVTSGNNTHGLIYRLLADGTPDPAFGDSGTFVVRPSGTGATGLGLIAVTTDGEGRLVAAGYEYRQDTSPPTDRAIIARLVGGALDPTFGTGGVSRALPIGTFASQVLALPDGRLVVTGVRNNPTFSCFAARLTAAGALDPTFGSGGVTLFNGPAGTFNEDCHGAAFLPDGRLVVGGTVIREGSGSVGLFAVFTSNGTLDSSFGDDGIATIPLCTGSCISNGGGGFVVDVAGRLVLAGTLSLDVAPGGDTFVARLLPSGTPDADFGTDGVVRGVLRTRSSGPPSQIGGAAIQPDGSLVLVGSAEGTGFQLDLLVARLLADGKPDPAFGDNGEALVEAGGFFDQGVAVALGPGGDIVAAGITYDGSTEAGLVVLVLGVGAVAAERGPEAGGLALRVAPHPVRDASTLTLDVAAPGSVRLTLYDALGREVARLHDGPLAGGPHTFPLPVGPLAPGLYVARADGPGPSASLRVVVARR